MTLDFRLAGRDPRTQHFLDRCSQKFGDRFDYSNFEYVNAKTASEIICRSHGPFQQNPDKHLNSIRACPGCASEGRSKAHKGNVHYQKPNLSLEEYLNRLNLPDKFTLDTENYFGLTKGFVTLTCPEHGISTYTPQALLINNNKCASCGRDAAQASKIKSFDDFVAKAVVRHGGKYSYPEQPYENRKSIVTIICPEHGEFTKKAQKHLTGQACYPCTLSEGIDAGKYPGGYSPRFFLENPDMEAHPAIVYYFRIGDLYKVGITIREIRLRVKSLKCESKKDVEVLDTYECPLLYAYNLEQRILEENAAHRVRRTWSTELFSKDILNHKRLEDYVIESFEKKEKLD